MSRTPESIDPVTKQLLSIKEILQHLLIIESAKAGLSKEQARQLVKMDGKRVSRIWKNLKLGKINN